MLKVGIVGAGMMGQHHIRVYKELGCDVVGVADINPETAKSTGERYQVPYFTDYHALFGKVEAVSIAVPTRVHCEVAMAFISHKVHCLIEKPIASTMTEAGNIVSASQVNDVKVLIGHIERFNPVVQKLKGLLDGYVLGDIYSFSAKRVGPHNPRIRDVGVIIDLATHDIDMMRYLSSSKPVSVYATTNTFAHPREDHAIITLCFENNIVGVVETNWLTPYKMRRLSIVGSKGVAEIDYINSKLTIYNQNGTNEMPVIPQEPLKVEISHFLSCITNNETPLVSTTDGIAVLSIAIAALESANTGKVVDLNK